MSKPKVYDIDRRLNAIRAWMHYNGVTPHRIATATDLSPGALRDIFKDSWNPKTSTLRVIEQFIEDYQTEARAAVLAAPARTAGTSGPMRGLPRGNLPPIRRS